MPASSSRSRAMVRVTRPVIVALTMLAVAVSLMACGGSASPTAATPTGSTPATGAGDALCGLSYSAFNGSAKVQANSVYSWTCTSTVRTVAGNGIPDHVVNTGNFATPISVQNIVVNFTLSPTSTGGVSGPVMNWATPSIA